MPASPAIYLDSNAAAPLHPKAREALLGLLEEASRLVPNPSSIHSHGRSSRRRSAEAREHVARSLGKSTEPEQLVFTSSGSESNQLAVRSVLAPLLEAGKNPHWIATKVEHDSNLQMVEWVERGGGSVSYLPVDLDGRPLASELPALWREQTALVSCVWANNETGVISDIAALAEIVRARAGKLHLDAAQAWGKLPIDVDAVGAHFISVSGHKIGGLAGCGALWVARGNPVIPSILGKQEKGRRGGTENLAGILTMGAAAGCLDPSAYDAAVRPLRDRLQNAIGMRIPGTIVNGAGAPRIGNTLNLSFDGVEGDGLVMALDLAGFSVSSGSACSSGALAPSHVLLAMGRTKAQATAAVRISLSEGTTWGELEAFIPALESAVSRVRGARGIASEWRERSEPGKAGFSRDERGSR